MAGTAGDDDRSFPEANVRAVRSLAGAVATTLGPTPRDKLLVGEDGPVVTSDGTAVLDTLAIEHPVAPIVRRISGPKRPGETGVEGQDIPDGVTSTVVLSAALLDEAMDLLDCGLHPTTIRRGYRTGLGVATDTLADLARPADGHLLGVARTAMTGNDVGGLGERWARIAVEAVETVGPPGPESFAVRTLRTGSVAGSRLVRGTVLDRNRITDDRMPRRVTDATVLMLDGQDEGGLRSLEYDDRYTARPESPGDLRALQEAGADRRERVLGLVREHGVDVVVAKQGIEKPYARALSEEGIVGVDGVTRLYLGQVARATGAVPIKHTEGFDAAALGHAGIVEAVAADPRPDGRGNEMVVIDGCEAPGAVCALILGVWGPLAETATTDLRKAAAAVAAARGLDGARPGVVPGGGAAESCVAGAVRDRAPAADDREGLAVEAFADAVGTLVYTLAKNGGRDPLATRADLRAANDAGGNAPQGLSLPAGEIVDAVSAGIVDPLAIRRHCYTAATEVASLIVGIDDAVSATISEPEPDPDDAIYEDAADQQQSYLADNESRWD